MLRIETKGRARALQLLYAWELQGRPPMAQVASGTSRLGRIVQGEPRVFDQAEALAAAVAGEWEDLDREAAGAADHWRLERMGMIERNILRIGIHELRGGTLPPKVAIDEAVRLAQWFGGPKAPGFINGVLDRVARALGRLA